MGSEESPGELAGSMLMQFYGQQGKKWSSALFPDHEGRLGRGSQVRDRFKDSYPNYSCLFVANYPPNGGFPCQSGGEH